MAAVKYSCGQWVYSCRGHDKGRLYLVVACDAHRLYLTDGKYRPVGKLKSKNPQHVCVSRVKPWSEAEVVAILAPTAQRSGASSAKLRAICKQEEKEGSKWQEKI